MPIPSAISKIFNWVQKKLTMLNIFRTQSNVFGHGQKLDSILKISIYERGQKYLNSLFELCTGYLIAKCEK